MYLHSTALVLALVPSTLAYSCISSIALPWPAGGIAPSGSGTSGGSGSATSACSAQCGNDSKCFQKCIDIALSGQCNAIGGSACPGNSVDLIGSGKGSGSSVDDLIKRATLECTTSEVCYKYTDNSLLCINKQTGNYHDDEGGQGNSGTGIYTSANGQVTTNAGGSTATRTSGTARTSTLRSSTTTGASSASSVAPAASASTSSRSATATAATTTPTSGAMKVGVDTIVGALGLGVGFIL